MIPDYKCNAVYFSSWLKIDYPDIYNGLTKILNSHDIAYDILYHTNDIWCRDYMPIQINNDKYFYYKYKPDYLINNINNHKYITDALDICRLMNLNIKESSFIIDGGNVVKVGNKVIMTDKVFFENPTVNKNILRKQLEKQMECEIIFIPWDRAEKYGHSDGIIKPISDNTILITNYHDFDKDYSKEIIKRLSVNFNIKILSYNVKNIVPESWAYINFLSIGNLIVLPVLGIDEDEQAFEQIKEYYPDCIIEQLNISNLVKKGGGLNCISWCRQVGDDERRFLTLYNRVEVEDDSFDKFIFTNEEIIFMCKKDIGKFSRRYPEIAEYYMKCLDD